MTTQDRPAVTIESFIAADNQIYTALVVEGRLGITLPYNSRTYGQIRFWRMAAEELATWPESSE